MDFEHILSELAHEQKDVKMDKSDKKAILADILPRKRSRWMVILTITSTSFALLLMLSIPFILKSKPGDALYQVKRLAEDVRSAVDPSFDHKLIEQREKERKEIQENEDSSSTSNQLQIVDTEILDIQKRINAKNTVDKATETNSEIIPDAVDDSSQNSITSNENTSNTGTSDTSDDPSSGGDSTMSNSGSNSGSSGTGSSSSGSNSGSGSGSNKTLSAKDQCKLNLDNLKKSGVDVDSDQYKACDNL